MCLARWKHFRGVVEKFGCMRTGTLRRSNPSLFSSSGFGNDPLDASPGVGGGGSGRAGGIGVGGGGAARGLL